MSRDLVSIVVTYYNTETYARYCINSLRNQTYKDIELILVDDVSVDRTREILTELSKEDERIRLIFREKNGGISEARVNGIENATGKWILIMDGDDVLAPDAIERFIEVSKKFKSIDIVYGQRIYSENPENQKWEKRKEEVWIEKGKKICSQIYKDERIDTPLVGKMYRAEYIKKFNLRKYKHICPQIFFEDILFTPILIYYANSVAILADSFWVHREVSTSVSRSGILWDFYYDQIESGNILLSFLKIKKLSIPWSIVLGKYLKVILRIWCLIDYYDLAEEKREDIKKKIKKYYRIYFPLYIKYGKSSILEKMICSGFLISNNGWKKLVQMTRYRNYQKSIQQIVNKRKI